MLSVLRVRAIKQENECERKMEDNDYYIDLLINDSSIDRNSCKQLFSIYLFF